MTAAGPINGRDDGAAPRLLVVEDDAALAVGLVRAFIEQSLRADSVGSGEEAIERISAGHYDLVVLDVGLPGIDGFEVLRRLRAAGHAMPVLVLTARDTVDDRVQGLNLGADDYMPKPFALPELVARVRALIRRSQSQHGPKIVHGPLVLDMSAQRAFLDGKPFDLVAREWAVLKVLLARVEKIVSKETIIQALVGSAEDLSANAVEVYVSRLRSKLDPVGIRIRTVRGYGYMLEEYRAPAGSIPPATR